MNYSQEVAKQALVLVDYSVGVKKGDRVLINSDISGLPLVLEIYKLCILRGASDVRVNFALDELSEIYFKNANLSQLKHFPKVSLYEIKNTDCVISIISNRNTKYLSGVDASKISLRGKVLRPIKEWRVEKTRWVATMYPVNAWAQEAGMSLDEYSKFVFDSVVKTDWKVLSKNQEKLKKLLDKTSSVRIKTEESDLSFRIKGRISENCDGKYNMPDGEVFTSVVENSTKGRIRFSYPAIYMGREFENVCLEFEKGKAVNASASKNEADLIKILNTDKGSRYIGEFGIGNNYSIKKFTKNILFDEKIGGTIHLALGSGYGSTLSKNKSAIHWDMICDLRDNGELWFDGKLVQKKGVWII